MNTAVEFPEPLYRQGEELARLRGETIEAMAIRALEREVSAFSSSRSGNPQVSLPLIPSKRPGALDLESFNFDDLLA